MALAPNGDAFVTGCASSGADNDLLTVRYDGTTGAVLWSATYVGSRRAPNYVNPLVSESGDGNDRGRHLVVDAAGDVVIAARVAEHDASGKPVLNLRVIKYRGTTGVEAWTVISPSTAGALFTAIAVGPAGDVYALGFGVTFPGGATVSKFDGLTGMLLWSSNLPSWKDARGLAVDAQGHAYVVGVAGNELRTISMNGATGVERWSAVAAGALYSSDVAIDPAGFVIVAAATDTQGTAPVIKYAAATGAELWRRNIPLGFGADVMLSAIRIDLTGDILLCAQAAEAVRVGRAMKLSGADGSTVWSHDLEDSSLNGRLVAIALDVSGDALVTGTITGNTVTSRLRGSDGARLWSRQLSDIGTGEGVASAVAVDAAGNVLISGNVRVDGQLTKSWRLRKYTGEGSILWDARSPPIRGSERPFGKQVSRPRGGRVAILAMSPREDDRGARLSLHDASDGRTLWQTFIPGATSPPQQRYPHELEPLVAIDAAGDLVVAVSRDNRGAILKFSGLTGDLAWSMPHGGPSSTVQGLALDSRDGIALVYSESGAAGIVKIAASGSVEWSQRYVLESESLHAVVVDRADDVIATGHVFRFGRTMGRTLKFFGATGAVAWQTVSDSSDNHVGARVAVDGTGEAYVVMQGVDTFGHGGAVLPTTRLVRYSGVTGTKVWENSFEGQTIVNALAMSPTGDPLVALGRGTRGEGGWRVARLSRAVGITRWQSDYAPPGNAAAPLAMAIDSQGQVVLAGYGASVGPNRKAYVAKWDGLTGERLWDLPVTGSSQYAEATGVSVGDDGAIFVAGMVADPGLPYESFLTKVTGGRTEGALPPDADSDDDGMPNAVEIAEGLNARIKDNDVFASPRLFTMQQYRDFLGREGDAPGIASWSNELTSGALTRAQLARVFFESAEFQNGRPQLTRLYLSAFNRFPDPAGLLFHAGRYRAGVPLATIAQDFASSQEFTLTYGALTDEQYVDRLYRNVLARAPDAGGLQNWVAQINAGMTRGEMLALFSESQEFRQLSDPEVFVTGVYLVLLRRVPDRAGFDFHVTRVEAGQPPEEIIGSFLDAGEYRDRFLP